ncbi:MAG: PilW family protein [Candidatus Accumulibacter sp. UW20]|jgi:type IV pilus assembly protein PilW
MKKTPSHPLRPASQAGFTLAEVMVAMVIGMIGMIIMMQVFATAEGQKRTTTGTGDAQTSGALALYELQRDIRQSGYGVNTPSLLTCALALGTPSEATLPALGPAIVNPRQADGTLLLPAGDDNTDTLLVTFGSSSGSPEGDAITAINPGDPKILNVQTPANFAVDDAVIAASAFDGNTSCALTLTLDRVSAVDAPRVTVDEAGAAAGQLLFNLGATPTIRAYAIRNGNLTVCDYLSNDCGDEDDTDDPEIWVPIASNIVSLRAEYGRDNDNTPGVETWNQTTPGTGCEWARTAALRIAVVARNSQVDQGIVTATVPTWRGGVAFDLTETANWQNYRYKVFETTVPIRNLPWMAKCS